MTDHKPNFILVPEPEAEEPEPPRKAGTPLLARVRSLATAAAALIPSGPAQAITRQLTAEDDFPVRPRLVFGFDATASREPAWATARQVTDALVKALPGELDVALAVHGGSRLHTFSAFTNDPNRLRDQAAGIRCEAGQTRLLSILSASLRRPGVRLITYIGDVYEESLWRGRTLADALGLRGIKLIILHDTADRNARQDAETFMDLARRTGGCVIPFDRDAPAKLRELLAAVAVLAVGGDEMLREKSDELPGAALLLSYLRHDR